MKNSIKIFLALLIPFLLTACGSRVEVPPAHVGKILTKNSYALKQFIGHKDRIGQFDERLKE